MQTLTRYETMKTQDLKRMRKTLLSLIVNSKGYRAYLLTEQLNMVKQALVDRTGDHRWR